MQSHTARFSTIAGFQEGTNAQLVVTVTPPTPGLAFFLTAITVGFGTAPATAVALDVTSQWSPTFKFRVGGAGTTRIAYTFPLRFAGGQPVTVTLPAAGTGVEQTLVVEGYFAPRL